MKLPVYELEISDDELNKSGVQYVAMVDDPAVQMDWAAFEEKKEIKFVADQERRIIMGVLMRADYPIFRKDDQRGDHYVKFKASTIDRIINKFSKLGYHNNVNLMHQKEAIAEGVYMRGSFQVDKSMGISAPKGMDVEEGSWIACYYVENDKIWEEVKAGTFKGFSVEGFFGYQFSAQIREEFVKPQSGESESDFMNRCIPLMIGEGKEQDQAVAMCKSMYNDGASKFHNQEIDEILSILNNFK